MGFQQLGAQGDIPVAAALALLDANHHAPTVDVAYLKTAQFGPPHGGGVQRHDKRAVIEITGGVDEAGYLF